MNMQNVITYLGLCASVSSILFAFLAFKRNERNNLKNEAKSEGLILSDIGYIKACVDRMEKNLINVDNRYRNLVERIVKLESIINT